MNARRPSLALLLLIAVLMTHDSWAAKPEPKAKPPAKAKPETVIRSSADTRDPFAEPSTPFFPRGEAFLSENCAAIPETLLERARFTFLTCTESLSKTSARLLPRSSSIFERYANRV